MLTQVRAGTLGLAVVRPGLIDISPAEGVRESWSTCTLLECAGFRVLVDLGHPKDSPGCLLSALAARGLRPADIHAVLFTHLHPDHIGHKDLFPGALFLFHEAERFAFYFESDRTLRLKDSVLLELDPEAVAHPHEVEGWPDLAALGPRLYLRHCPGHTPGSLVVFACVDGRVHAVAGDIILNRDCLEHGRPPGSSWKPQLIPEQMQLIADRADVIVPGHGAPFDSPGPRTPAGDAPVVNRPDPGLGPTEES